MYWFVRRRWPQEFDGVLSGDGAGRVIETVPFHQMVSGSPIAMAVEHSARNAATQHSRECLLVALRLPVGNNFIAGREAANVEALFVCGATPKTLQVRRVSFLDAFLGHCYLVTDVLRCVRNHVRLKTAGRIFIRRLRRLHRSKLEQQQLLRGFCSWRAQLLPEFEALHFARGSVRQVFHEDISPWLLETWQC